MVTVKTYRVKKNLVNASITLMGTSHDDILELLKSGRDGVPKEWHGLVKPNYVALNETNPGGSPQWEVGGWGTPNWRPGELPVVLITEER